MLANLRKSCAVGSKWDKEYICQLFMIGMSNKSSSLHLCAIVILREAMSGNPC